MVKDGKLHGMYADTKARGFIDFGSYTLIKQLLAGHTDLIGYLKNTNFK